MNADLDHQIKAHVQALARHFISWTGTLDSLLDFLIFSMGSSAPDRYTLENSLRRSEFQRDMESHWEAALWQSTNKSWHLVTLAVPTDPAIARRRLNHFPASPSQCRWCQQDSKGFAHLEMVQEKDINGAPVPASYLHEQCRRPWMQLRALVDDDERQRHDTP